MNATIAEARPEVGETAPKIASFQIPIDRIGEVIGPKGKVINLIQQETGADIAVDDDGTVGTVTIGSPDGRKVEAAKERIMLIIDPPTANVGEVYTGKVVNITKFGAFVNILPGRDGLVHISKLGPRQAHQPGGGRGRPRRRDRRARRRHRRPRQGQPAPRSATMRTTPRGRGWRGRRRRAGGRPVRRCVTLVRRHGLRTRRRGQLRGGLRRRGP